MYYQPQPATYNRCQQYCHDRRTKDAPFRNDYDGYKVGIHGNTHCGIPTPDKKIPIIPLRNDFYDIKKKPTNSSVNSLIT